jgi:hypothetical protein
MKALRILAFIIAAPVGIYIMEILYHYVMDYYLSSGRNLGMYKLFMGSLYVGLAVYTSIGYFMLAELILKRRSLLSSIYLSIFMFWFLSHEFYTIWFLVPAKDFLWPVIYLSILLGAMAYIPVATFVMTIKDTKKH